ncbi:hypothetical protein K474DRAFT_578836 [Panus rudis PR-1116 ss-1]|nr:hypothetical protein K474DRAFT_578836 [Panus rudis PR-1116 ss-1]
MSPRNNRNPLRIDVRQNKNSNTPRGAEPFQRRCHTGRPHSRTLPSGVVAPWGVAPLDSMLVHQLYGRHSFPGPMLSLAGMSDLQSQSGYLLLTASPHTLWTHSFAGPIDSSLELTDTEHLCPATCLRPFGCRNPSSKETRSGDPSHPSHAPQSEFKLHPKTLIGDFLGLFSSPHSRLLHDLID